MANRNARRPIKADESTSTKDTPKYKILGEFSGECVESNIVNENDMFIGPDVWKYLFASEDFKRAIELGHYIGFLGHPEDPGCQDFKNACIVMTEGHIEPDGRVYGKFNLIDTPVGRIVKAFIDAGVQFGISVRGAGDLVGNSVEPETFIFRGFDLVTFPAYPNSIPTFQEIAASKDLRKQQKYNTVCTAINSNLESIYSTSTIDQIRSQFKSDSHVYMSLTGRRAALDKQTTNAATNIDNGDNIDTQQLEAMTNLFMSTKMQLASCKSEIRSLKFQLKREKVTAARKLSSIKRITTDQIQDLESVVASTEKQRDVAIEAKREMSKTLRTVQASERLLKKQVQNQSEDSDRYNQEIDKLTKENLKYKQTISANKAEIERQNSTISKLRSDMRETVTASREAARNASNRDVEMSNLRREIQATRKLLEDYQDAFSELYASAIGTDISNVTVTASTTVDQLKRAISAESNVIPDNMLDYSDVADLELDSLLDDNSELITT